MSKHYKIKGLSPMFDGLIVETCWESASLITIQKVYNPNVFFGDRLLSVELPVPGMMISKDYLEECVDPSDRTFAHDNPYGKFLREDELPRAGYVLHWVQYEKAFQVAIKDPNGRVVFSDVFFKMKEEAETLVVKWNSPRTCAAEPEDFIFKFKDIKEKESNG